MGINRIVTERDHDSRSADPSARTTVDGMAGPCGQHESRRARYWRARRHCRLTGIASTAVPSAACVLTDDVTPFTRGAVVITAS